MDLIGKRAQGGVGKEAAEDANVEEERRARLFAHGDDWAEDGLFVVASARFRLRVSIKECNPAKSFLSPLRN